MAPPSPVLRSRPPTPGAGETVAVLQSPDEIARYLEDAAHFSGGRADAIGRPRTEAEVADLLRTASRVLPVGAQSSVTGGATPDGGLVLSTERLTAFHESGQEHFRVGAGVPLATLQNLLAERERWYAPTPTFTGAFIGGVISTNAAGAATFKYGTTRAWIDGLTVVLACGHVLDIERGETKADEIGALEIQCPHGAHRVRIGTYRLPDVPKCSAGYFAAPGMDLIDLFIGSEGTLGVVVDAMVRVLPARPAVAMALVPVPAESDALAFVDELRRESRTTWASGDPRGIDVAAVESLDRRCLAIVREDGVERQQDVSIPDTTAVALIIQLELPAGTTSETARDQIADARSASAPDSAIGRFCRLLDRRGLFDDTEMALPGDDRRAEAFLAIREAAPVGVNRRAGEAKRLVDPRIEKTAADMIVPFDRFGEMSAIYRAGFERRGLDYAIWGHVSDGNVHPNVIPKTYADVVAGREAILEFGREAARLGGCPLAEHGVGRSPLKQALLSEFYGAGAIAEMRAVKRALDPEGKLAPGVICS
jgi:D-lactate dehydrogenase (cytochrome)